MSESPGTTWVCPNGHTCTASDYCDVCGAPVDPATAQSPAPSAPAPVAGAEPGATAACPSCGTPHGPDALFCEGCGYDFTTGTRPRPLDPPVGSAPAQPYADLAHAPDLSSPAPPRWVVEVWIDPAWYTAQQSPDPLPSAGLPRTVVLTGRSALVGRVSVSRNIHPEVDCEDDSGVSRRQAQLTTDGTRWWVEDLESANGTFVGAASGALPTDPIPVGRKHELDADDRVYVGAFTRLVVRPASSDERG